MFKTKTAEGKNNICGEQVFRIRKAMKPKLSQRALAERLQLCGMDVDKNAVQRIECGKRFVTDMELLALAAALAVPVSELLPPENEKSPLQIEENLL